MLNRSVVVMTLVTSLGLFVMNANAEEAKKPWKNETELSLVTTNGNSKATSISGKNNFKYDWEKFSMEVFGGGLGTKSEGRNTAEQYFAGQKGTYKFDDKNYLYEKYQWDKDRFAGIKSRNDLSAGLGRHLLDLKNDKLMVELGGGYVIEDRYNQPKNDFAAGRAYAKYEHIISETAKFSQDGEYLHNFEDSSDYRVNAESALIAALSAHFSLKASYKIKHLNQPPRGFGKTDTITAVSLIATY